MGHDYKSTIFLHVKVMCNGLQTENDKKGNRYHFHLLLAIQITRDYWLLIREGELGPRTKVLYSDTMHWWTGTVCPRR